jgi:hypothetical protein
MQYSENSSISISPPVTPITVHSSSITSCNTQSLQSQQIPRISGVVVRAVSFVHQHSPLNFLCVDCLTVHVLKSSVIWDIMPFSPIKVNQCFGIHGVILWKPKLFIVTTVRI